MSLSSEQPVEEAFVRSFIQRSNQFWLVADEDGRLLVEYCSIFDRMPGGSKHREQNSNEKKGAFLEFLLANFRINNETRDRIRGALANCLGSDQLFFAAMQEYLPQQLLNRNGITYQIEWYPLSYKNGITFGIAVGFSKENDKSTKVVGPEEPFQQVIFKEILDCSDQHPVDFIEEVKSELVVIHETIAQAKTLSRIRAPLTTLHTLKGNASVIGFKTLAKRLHRLESAVTELESLSDREKHRTLLDEIMEVINLTLSYIKLLRGLFAKSSPISEAQSSDVVISILQHVRELVVAEQSDAAQSLIDSCLFAIKTPYNLTDILNPLIDHARALAVKDKKPAPEISVKPKKLKVRKESISLLRSIMGQLLSNSVRHGLELPIERLRRGKPARGKIEVSFSPLGESIQLVVRDDGRGLNLARLRGFLRTSQEVDDQVIADIIFTDGISTQTLVDHSSGRGYGLKAVKELVKSKNGVVNVDFTSEHAENGFRKFEICIILPREVFMDYSK